MSKTVNKREIEHFQKDSDRWWDESGPFAPLHRMNPVRMKYIRSRIVEHFGRDPDSLTPLKDLDILDVGCGGGLVCEPLCRLGASVTGLDADAQAIAIARDHADKASLDIRYEAQSSEDHAAETKKRYDVVLGLEILEHVDDRDFFIRSCRDLCKDDGLVILSTLNRTPKSFALGIVAAEYILGWVPRGTHSWKKFVKPSELTRLLESCDMTPQDLTGIKFDPLAGDFKLSGDIAVNYFLTATPS